MDGFKRHGGKFVQAILRHAKPVPKSNEEPLIVQCGSFLPPEVLIEFIALSRRLPDRVVQFQVVDHGHILTVANIDRPLQKENDTDEASTKSDKTDESLDHVRSTTNRCC